MPSRLADAHIRSEERLRKATIRAVERLWNDLPAYDQPNADQWLSKVIPIALAAQRSSVVLTEAFLARALRRQPIGINPDDLIGAGARNGTSPEEVYYRPFVTLWSSLKAGNLYDDAVNAGLARATSTAAMDVQLAMRATANAVEMADDAIYGYQRVADGGACNFCLELDGAYVKSADAFALHNNCGCGLEPLTSPHPRSANPLAVAVHQHGELGPVLGDPAHDFTSL